MTHPLDDPNFNPDNEVPVWYMAHPLAGDDEYTYEQNMAHIPHMMKLLFDCGLRVVAPYHTCCLALDDRKDEDRRIGLELDCYIVRKLQRVILTGHKVTRGMHCEADTCLKAGGVILNLTKLKDSLFERQVDTFLTTNKLVGRFLG